jgi:pimeloyl-ACP methyl ester carboxylesterase
MQGSRGVDVNAPPVRYVHTATGLGIAYTDSGDGSPLLLVLGPPISNFGEGWDLGPWGEWLRRLASRHRLVFIDLPGLGLSDPDVSDVSYGTIEEIVLLVADTLGIERFALMSAYAGAAALLLADAHPERVSALVLINPVALDYAAYKEAAPITAMRGAFERDFDTYLYLMTTAGLGHHVERDQAEAFFELVRRSNRPEAIRAYFDSTDEWSLALRDRLPLISVPTLITWPREPTAYGTIDSMRRVVGALPDARLVLTDGDAVFPTTEMATSADRAIEAFFAEQVDATSADHRGFQTIVFTDLGGRRKCSGAEATQRRERSCVFTTTRCARRFSGTAVVRSNTPATG